MLLNRKCIGGWLHALVGRSRYRGGHNSNKLFYNVTSNPQWEGESINKCEVTALWKHYMNQISTKITKPI